jgi:precorrin-6A synthase
MRKLFVIGIGAGDPAHLTLEAIAALQQVEVFFSLDKGESKEDLLQLRKALCARHIRDGSYRFVAASDPVRDSAIASYTERVAHWHEQRALLYEGMLRDELREDGVGGVLVWGDPALYDSTLRIVERVLARGNIALDYTVIPGISSVQVLAAKHKIALNRIAGAVHITTGRRLAEAELAAYGDVVVMLDGECAFKRVRAANTEIYWGAYLGTEHELLLAGPLEALVDEIERVRSAARARHGWIMDVYLLHRRAD